MNPDITFTTEDRELCQRVLEYVFPADEPDPKIDMIMIARLNGVVDTTPQQWRQRTAKGIMRIAFPKPDDDRYEDKPQWLMSSIVKWMKRSRRWPPGSVGRPETRGPREAVAA